MAIVIVVLVIVIVGLDILFISVISWVGVMVMVISGCLKLGEIYGVICWDVIFLLVGLIFLGIVMENFGIIVWFVSFLVDVGGYFFGYVLLFLFYFVIVLLMEILFNNVIVVLMLFIVF